MLMPCRRCHTPLNEQGSYTHPISPSALFYCRLARMLSEDVGSKGTSRPIVAIYMYYTVHVSDVVQSSKSLAKSQAKSILYISC